MRSRRLLSPDIMKPYRECSDCGCRYTVDSRTRKRQLPIAALALLAFGLTIAVGVYGMAWLLPAIASHIVLWIYIGLTVSKMTYVQYPD